MSLFGGFPYPAGASEVVRVSLPTGTVTTAIGNLNTAIDALPIPNQSGNGGTLVLEFSTDLLGGAPGRLLHFASFGAAPTVLSNTLSNPASVAYDASTSAAYVAEPFVGAITEIPVP